MKTKASNLEYNESAEKSTFTRNISDSILYTILVAFLLISFFCPVWVSESGLYYCSFILADLAAAVFVIYAGFFRPAASNTPGRDKILFAFFLLYILCNLYFTIRYHGWYWDFIDKSISFLFFFTVAIKLDHTFISKFHVIETILIIGALSSLASLIFYLCGYDQIIFSNFSFSLLEQGAKASYSDIRLTWVYVHKSTYSMILLLLSALTLQYRKLFKYQAIPISFMVIFAISMILSNTMTAIAGLGVIYVAYAVNIIFAQKGQKTKIIIVLVLMSCCFICAALFLYWLSNVRNITSLGNRIPIWKASLEAIKENPRGLGTEFEKIYLYNNSNNCHSTFLNEILRFSIPVGGLYALFFIVFMALTFWKNKIFSLTIWVVFLVCINMDYVLQAQTLSMVLIMLYFLFDFEAQKPKSLYSVTDLKQDPVKKVCKDG